MITKDNIRLIGAIVGIDPANKRWMVCRGAYIVSTDGLYYMSKRGTWNHGIPRDDEDSYFWYTEADAQSALAKLKAAALQSDGGPQ